MATPEIFEPITALHQQVREFVEQAEPNYRVIDIQGQTTTNYMVTHDTMDELQPYKKFVHCYTGMRFQVTAVYLHYTLKVEVHVDSDGQLLVTGRPQVSG
jgi:hypothetical protein